jgi:hypothetical protein
MKSYVVNVGIALAIGAGVAANGVFAQQAPVKRDFEAETRTALRAAKDASEFEFLGTLARVCLLPQSGGEDASDKPFGIRQRGEQEPDARRAR